jgi:3',5'-cyclic AMP phosphodiesterase CpdA
MTVLLQISDTHFGTERPDVLEALVALALEQRPDLVVLSGDITQRARAAQFQAARAFVGRLGAPVLAVPGNHDIAVFNLLSRVFYPYAGYQKAFGDSIECVHSSRDLLVVAVNTTRRYRHIHGEVSAQQVDRVANLLGAAQAEQLRVVVAHQPIAAIRLQDEHNLLRGHASAQQRWAAAGADIVMGGHIHLPYVKALQGLGRPMWAVQAGTAVSRRVRAGVPNSVNLLRWAGGRCKVEQWDFSAADKVFACAKVTEVRPWRESASLQF